MNLAFGHILRSTPQPALFLVFLLLPGPSLRAPAQTTTVPPTVAADLQRAEAALKTNNQATAAQLFQSVLKLDPTNAEAHANLGAIAFVHGDCSAAEPDFRAALDHSPGLTKVQALLSLCEHRRGDASAMLDMEAAFSRLDDPRLLLQLGMELANAYYQQGDLEKTASTLRSLLNTNPDNTDVLFFAQRVYSELSDNTLNKLAVLAPHSGRMEQLIAERLINAGDLKDAAEHYRKALELSPRLPGIHFELAETLLESSPNSADAQKAALSELDAAKQVDGDSAKIEVQFGRIATLQSNPAAALSHYRQAFQFDPSDTKAQMGLAELYRQQNKPEEAARYLHMAIQSDPFNPEAHYKLSQVDRQLHHDEESKQQLQLFLDLRATQDKVKLLYRQMSPQTATADPAAATR